MEGCRAPINPLEQSKGRLRHGLFPSFCYHTNIDDSPMLNARRQLLLEAVGSMPLFGDATAQAPPKP